MSMVIKYNYKDWDNNPYKYKPETVSKIYSKIFSFVIRIRRAFLKLISFWTPVWITGDILIVNLQIQNFNKVYEYSRFSDVITAH